jgi:hypothetical protein
MPTKIASYLFIYLFIYLLSNGTTQPYCNWTQPPHPSFQTWNCSLLQWTPWQKKTEMFIRGTSEINPVNINTTKKARKLTLSGKIDKMWISLFTLVSYKHQRANLYIEDIWDMHSLAHSTVAMSRWNPCILFSNVQTSSKIKKIHTSV